MRISAINDVEPISRIYSKKKLERVLQFREGSQFTVLLSQRLRSRRSGHLGAKNLTTRVG